MSSACVDLDINSRYDAEAGGMIAFFRLGVKANSDTKNGNCDDVFIALLNKTKDIRSINGVQIAMSMSESK